jgi:RNA polymerase sigma-70 factor (ECF subfamily)
VIRLARARRVATEGDAASAENADFVERLKRRDKAAVTTFVRTYTGQLYRASVGLGLSDSLSAELVQSVWSSFFEVAPRFEGRSHIRTYLFGILYNKARELRRESARVELRDDIDEVVEQRFAADGTWVRPPADPETLLLGREALTALERCLEALSTRQRLAFVLKEVDGLSHAEICNVLDLSLTNVGVVLFRARNLLRECLEGKGLKRRRR